MAADRLLRVCLKSKLQASWKKSVTIIGSRPPTESLSKIQAASLLEKNPKSARPRTIVFADGNRAWELHAKSLKIKHAKVSHQTKNGPNKCEEPPVFSCPLWQGRKSLTDGGKA